MTDEALSQEVERQLGAMRAGAVDFYGEEELRGRLAATLRAGRPLRIKLGMDPSSPNLHLGHTVVIQKLKTFQDLGHTPIFLVGDFTAMIGDPSGRNKTRPVLDREEVRANAATYVEQVGRILDTGRAEVRFNSEWMDPMSAADVVRLCSLFTVARLLERDDFSKRFERGAAISVHEFLYPFVQAYDSVALRADVELGGTDQTFNLLMAREIQRDHGQPPQAVLTHPLLVGLDGTEKMSKSLGNTIGITEPPDEIYGKTMRLSDTLMLDYFDLLAGREWGDLEVQRREFGEGRGDPFAFKQELAARLVTRFCGAPEAQRAAEHFRRVVQRKQTPEAVPEASAAAGPAGERGLLELLVEVGLVKSNSEGRRLVGQGAVSIDGEVVSAESLRLGTGAYLIRVGKRRFVQLRIR
nr:tyrosine--tRNA ligase [Myxococcota bacterium]MDP6244631.1 tyrosine--tRNA ligase [Myxococcota bacterium]MDP7073601.1 tyrosine--tRNA ligase [Myxococcota bacterium]MDP7298131.1 tyrosine--tRNA ligase [Myxococcota bacterium]MDP7433652.1 tyrosine--tRNA ligase [Myxococcota bacterium]